MNWHFRKDDVEIEESVGLDNGEANCKNKNPYTSRLRDEGYKEVDLAFQQGSSVGFNVKKLTDYEENFMRNKSLGVMRYDGIGSMDDKINEIRQRNMSSNKRSWMMIKGEDLSWVKTFVYFWLIMTVLVRRSWSNLILCTLWIWYSS